MFRQLGRRFFKGTPLESLLWAVYDGIRQRWKMRALRPQGWYSVNPKQENIQEFVMYSDGFGAGERAKIRGEYEPEVTRYLLSLVDQNTVFWEVGGRYGYHSHFMAQLADQVVAFEADSTAAAKHQEAIQRNGFDNVQVVEGTVGEDVSLEDYPNPDIVLMDIEGWEQEVLESIKQPLQSGAIWIVEMHEKGVIENNHSERQEVETRFESFGYTTQKIAERRPGNYHLLATPNER